ncbi:hypothetical protein DL89DRAFT_48536 [Linderina pennispora]|uniref:Uncharacterized protein n=1 Tax=Linderina pennispora TaxID=61395 RepID=A0A1Y1W2F9_9FUNG|nr:uncharacterized protein DL89DRAFT_48536 [Linderina pennispora]ORX67668.1 hypothetical protein DL89DRAFT_48536 [Linderina pennispora]
MFSGRSVFFTITVGHADICAHSSAHEYVIASMPRSGACTTKISPLCSCTYTDTASAAFPCRTSVVADTPTLYSACERCCNAASASARTSTCWSVSPTMLFHMAEMVLPSSAPGASMVVTKKTWSCCSRIRLALAQATVLKDNSRFSARSLASASLAVTDAGTRVLMSSAITILRRRERGMCVLIIRI